MQRSIDIDWPVAFKAYQYISELCSDKNFSSRATEFIKMICSAYGADQSLVVHSSMDVTVYGSLGTIETTQDSLTQYLPMLFDSYPYTRFSDKELHGITSDFEAFSDLSICDGYYYSFTVEPGESIWILLFNEESSGAFSEKTTELNTQVSEIIEQFFTLAKLGNDDVSILTALQGQKKQQSIWLESLDWLNSHGKQKLSKDQLSEFYGTSLYQLMLLANAEFSASFRVNTERRALQNVSTEEAVDGLYDKVMETIKSDFPWDTWSTKDSLYELTVDMGGLAPGVGILLIFPIFIQKKVKRLLCLGLSSPLGDSEHKIVKLFTEGLNHIVERNYFQGALSKSIKLILEEKEEQEKLIEQLEETKDQLFQQEKLASIGQLAAGVAHEINNPVGYVSSNINILNRYIDGLFDVLNVYKSQEASLSAEAQKKLEDLKSELDFEDYRDDISEIISESKEGVSRVKQIVGDLKDFSHVSESDWQLANLASGIESTLNIVHNELKFKATVIKEFDDIPEVECVLSRINQVVMNLLVNASHAIDEKGVITIRLFSLDDDFVCIEVEDTGHGIDEEHLAKLFDPFFTTKPVGEGTGLGLSLSYSVAETHGGELTVRSVIGEGTTFRLRLPVRQNALKGESR